MTGRWETFEIQIPLLRSWPCPYSLSNLGHHYLPCLGLCSPPVKWPERKLSYLHGVTNTVEGVGQIMLYLAPSSSPSWPLAVYHSWPHGSPFSLSFPHPFLLYGVYISLSTRDLTSFRYFVVKQPYTIVVHSTKLNVFCSITLISFLTNKVALFFLSVLPDFLSWGRNEKVRR